MSLRELVVLGTASQAPTRYRNHNGYLLRWDGEGVLFDPGEGTQRQMTLAGVAASAVTRICITHFHGDHCLGLPGVVQRLSLDRVAHPVPVHFPVEGRVFYDRLRHASVFEDHADVHARPVAGEGVVDESAAFRLVALRLDHGTHTVGWRLEEPDSRRMLPERLEALGVRGPDIGRLQREGVVELDGGRVTLDEASEPRRGQRMAFVMDTRPCDAARRLAEGVDLLVCESTFLTGEEDLARSYGHMTARQAAELAADAGVSLLVLAHFSQRHGEEQAFVAEAERIFPSVVAARDLHRIAVPGRT